MELDAHFASLVRMGQKRETACHVMKWALKPGVTIEIKGWQMNLSTACEFVFTKASESM